MYVAGIIVFIVFIIAIIAIDRGIEHRIKSRTDDLKKQILILKEELMT